MLLASTSKHERRIQQLQQQLYPDRPTPNAAAPLLSISDTSAFLSSLHHHVILSSSVHSALLHHQPVIALESTIISHGMAFPYNLQTALQVEEQARQYGATPATIAILQGKIHVGLSQQELEYLAKLGLAAKKCSRRDLALIVSEKGTGSTTVAATMIIAHMVGIPIFATGGIGGVHRGVEDTMDISADLQELGRTPVTVVCAGVKSILDIPRTLEYLETMGVPVVTYQSSKFPAFFSPDSGCKSPLTLTSHNQCAQVIQRQKELHIMTGILIAVPIPTSAAAIGEEMEKATQQALQEMKSKNIQGAEATPFLLLRIAELTAGTSLKANIALIMNNVKNAALIAQELHSLSQHPTISPSVNAIQPPSFSVSSSSSLSSLPSFSPLNPPRVVVVGGINQDLLCRASTDPSVPFLLGTSNPGTIERVLGGVGRNIAEVLARLELSPLLVGTVGGKNEGEAERIIRECQRVGIRREGFVTLPEFPNDTYVAILDKHNDLFTTITAMQCADQLTPQLLPWSFIQQPELIIIDANIHVDTINSIGDYCMQHAIPLWFEPTSIEKSGRGRTVMEAGAFTFISPSAAELLIMAERAGYKKHQQQHQHERPQQKDYIADKAAYLHNHDDTAITEQALYLLDSINRSSHTPCCCHLIVKRGARGVLLASRQWGESSGTASSNTRNLSLSSHSLHSLSVPSSAVLASSAIVSTSGAGDSLVGASAWALLDRLYHGQEKNRLSISISSSEVLRAVHYGMRAAELTLQSRYSVSQDITRQKLDELHRLHNKSQM